MSPFKSSDVLSVAFSQNFDSVLCLNANRANIFAFQRITKRKKNKKTTTTINDCCLLECLLVGVVVVVIVSCTISFVFLFQDFFYFCCFFVLVFVYFYEKHTNVCIYSYQCLCVFIPIDESVIFLINVCVYVCVICVII